MKTKHPNWGGARRNAGIKKSTKFRTVAMKIPVPIANVVVKHAEQQNITRVAALADIWENNYAPKQEIITSKGKLERLEKENQKLEIIQARLAEWKPQIESGKGPRWVHAKKLWEELTKVFD